MAPKHLTPWAWALLSMGSGSKQQIVGDQEIINRCCFWLGFSTLYLISDRFKVGLRLLVNAYSSHSIQHRCRGRGTILAILFIKPRRQAYQAQRELIMGTKWFNSKHKLVQFLGCKGVDTLIPKINRTGWDYGDGHVALQLVTSWTLVYLGFSTQLCCVGSGQ